jgi:hypothetical protein
MTIGYIKAQTHGPEYSWHKYWSRKPANVVSQYLKQLVAADGLVVDPFCGSGVVIYESMKLGISAIGTDVNPIARSISKFLVEPIDADEYRRVALNLIDDLESQYGQKYLTSDGRQIRFLIHHVQAKCLGCSNINTFHPEIHGQNGKKCDRCGERMSFGLVNLVGTQVNKVVCIDPSEVVDSDEIDRQSNLSDEIFSDGKRFDIKFVDNKRTLTNHKFGVGAYFTNRNFSILSEFAHAAHKVTSEPLRRALLLTLTSSSAQASRLIASRGGLKSGGQAWTIPGFWIPPVHLESNPFIHLRARVEKLHTALKYSANSRPSKSDVKIMNATAKDALRDLIGQNLSADLVFLDPPYGDSVAFLEFSAIWNAFIGEAVNYGDDISVSDRTDSPMSSNDYLEELKEILKLVSDLLKTNGKALLTFNNISLESWMGVIDAFQFAGLAPIEINYQDPAVISSKTQMAIGGSYVGDFYVVYEKSADLPSKFEDVEELFLDYLNKVAGVRGGRVPYPVLQRYALEYWLENNIEACDLLKIDDLISQNFESDGKFRISKSKVSYPSLSEILQSQIQLASDNRRPVDDEFLIEVKGLMREYGTPSFFEIRDLLNDVSQSGLIKNESNLQLLLEF